MLEKNQSNTSQRKMQIVDFLDIDTSKITFQKPKSNKYNGSQIGILYNGETMFVKYEGIAPFGLKETLIKMVTIKVQACKLIVKINISKKLKS